MIVITAGSCVLDVIPVTIKKKKLDRIGMLSQISTQCIIVMWLIAVYTEYYVWSYPILGSFRSVSLGKMPRDVQPVNGEWT